MSKHLAWIWLAVFAQSALALRPVTGLKYPNSAAEGSAPVATEAWVPDGAYAGFSDLLPYVMRSPHQEEAGSCLYMSLTGVAEFWLSYLNPGVSNKPEGPLDLSERYLMNIAGVQESGNDVVNWKTDSVYLFNNAGFIARNADYRFTKGWVKKNAQGDYVKSSPTDAGAGYDARYNWINESLGLDASAMVRLPLFEREVLFADPASDQWNVGVMPADIIERIKSALVNRRAPVQIIYNHYGYWHAVDIVGFDDDADTKGCSFVTKFMPFMDNKALEQRARGQIAAAEKTERISAKAKQAFADGGGCHPKGMFYVRDSIYTGDRTGPIYDYDLSRTGDEWPYSRPIIMHGYDWVRYMANHATQIYLKN